MSFSEYIRRVLAAIALVAFALLVWALQSVILLAFAAVVVGVMLGAAAYPLRHFAHLGQRTSVLIATAVVVVALGLLVWIGWPYAAEQASALDTMLSSSLSTIEDRTGLPIGDALDRLADNPGDLLGGIWRDAFSFATTVASVATTAFLVVMSGVYLALDPSLYKSGVVLLTPRNQQDRVRKGLDRTGLALQLWLVGKVAAMTITGVLVGLGAWLIGLPSPIALGLIAFLTAFVPIIGPIIGAIPGLLLSFADGGATFVWTAGLYLIVQQVESNMITPVVQRRAASIPPALFIISIVAMGALFGTIGLVLSGPLTVASYALVRALYVEEVLGKSPAKEHGI